MGLSKRLGDGQPRRMFLTAEQATFIYALLLLVVQLVPWGHLLFVLTPLPLFLCGLAGNWKGILVGSLIVSLLEAAFFFPADGLARGLSFFMMVGGPCAYLSYYALLSRPLADGRVTFYPIGYLYGWLLLIGVVIFSFQCFQLALAGEEDLRRVLVETLDQMMALLEVPSVVGQPLYPSWLPDTILGSSIALLLVILAANGLAAQALLRRRGLALRQDPGLVFCHPLWSLAILALCIPLAHAPGNLGFIAQGLLMIMAVPLVCSFPFFLRRFRAPPH